ncbi:E3 ubiquitin ligase family protein [Salinarchaeum laminariae]|uniref:E3 ubiquitin ligase family protein n=1 Tax=Salinarchaeum laminariae TaxID=869888 RepID=UPI0020C07017|nr:E3 ubiquitin ligase family protein [Salinarchaeum laminariae]
MVPTISSLAPAIDASAAAAWLLQSGSSGDSGELFVFLLIGFFGGLYLVYDGFGTWQLSRLVQDTPTSRVRSMSVGRVELEGIARTHEDSVTPPLADEECVYVDWEAEKRERRVDDDGDVHYEWVTTARGTRALAFELDDDTGSVLVRGDRDDPEFDLNEEGNRRTQTYGSGEPAPEDVRRFVSAKGDPSATGARDRSADEAETDGLLDDITGFAADLATDSLDDTSNRRRYSETVLPLGRHVYVFGSADSREDARMETSEADLLEIRRDPGTDEFLISDSTEGRLQESYGRWGPIEAIVGLAISAASLFVLLNTYQLHELLG